MYNGLSRGDFFISLLTGEGKNEVNNPNGLRQNEFSKEFKASLSSNISYFFKKGIHVIFSGNLYVNNPAEAVLNDYSLNKEASFKNFNGKFALCIFDENLRIFYLASDRVNSYKIFYKITGNMIYAGTNIDYFNNTDEKLDFGAVGSYLVNSAPLINKTIYSNILKVPASSFVKYNLNDNSVETVRYWELIFTDEYKRTKPDELIEELKRILIRSFKRRLSDNKKVLVSYSGGSDSRGLLALLTSKEINYDNVEVFTYKYGKVKKDDPTYISIKTAEKKGFKVKLLEEYNNNIESCIDINVKLGKGYAHYCTDVDAWESLKQDYDADNNKVIVGDIIDGVPIGFKGDYTRALEKNYIYSPLILSSYKEIFKDDYYDKILNEYQNDYNQILDDSRKYKNVLDSMWHIYLDQRVSNILNVYRENYISYFIDVETPYYDNEVLDFLSKLPLNHRLYKRIFIDTFKKIAPDIMNFKYPSQREEYIDWDYEIIRNAKLENELISNSRLDKIISEELIINNFKNLQGLYKNYNYINYLYKLHKIINKVFPNYYRIILKDDTARNINLKLKHKQISNFYLKYMILKRVLNQ